MPEKRAVTMEKLVSLCKTRGFIFPGSEIYGGLANTWDYGPLGVELKNNVKKAWWKKFVQESAYNTGVDCAILMNTRTWKASGHLGGFSDPLMDCKCCKARHRADDLSLKNMRKSINWTSRWKAWTTMLWKRLFRNTKFPVPSAAIPILRPSGNSI